MKAFLDANVFAFGFSSRDTNSSLALDLAQEKRFVAVTSELALRETKNFFLRHFDERRAYEAGRYVEKLCRVVRRENLGQLMRRYSGKIVEKDLENLAAAKHERVEFIVAYDRHYAPFKEYATPKEFVKKFGLKPFWYDY